MDKNIRRVLVLLFLIVIPFLIYAFLQVKSLKEDEKMAQAIYEKQMETVLFSLNQYANNLMERWIRQLSDDDTSIFENAFDLVLGNESIQMLVLRKMATKKDSIFLSDYVALADDTEQGVNQWYQSKDKLLTQLTQYLSAGFQKIQAADDWVILKGLRSQQTGITVMVYDQDSTLYNALFIFEPTYWVEQLIGAKIQEMAQDEYNLAVFQDDTTIIYATSPFDIEKTYFRKGLWILPNTDLVIQARGLSYSELIKKRSRNNGYILLFSVLTLLIGAVIMVRNIKNALKIAQLKSDFVSNVSHEIRTPLSLIRMYAETLMMGRLPSEEKKQHYYQVIHHESGKLAYLVNNILDFSKIEGNQKKYKKVATNMNPLVQQIYKNYDYIFKEQGVHCEIILFPSPIYIKIDPQAFDLAVSNLLENGVKFSGKEKNISIMTNIENGFACCHIADNGMGIPTHLQTKIFDKFYRIENALTRKTKGTGLGLSLVKHIMDAHDGTISVSSKPNKGSVFTLKFPIQND